MSEIRCIYTRTPNFPATDQHPQAQRYTIGGYVVDAIGGAPTLDEVTAMLAPPDPAPDPLAALQQQLADQKAVITQLLASIQAANQGG